jgi:hypothetical protein
MAAEALGHGSWHYVREDMLLLELIDRLLRGLTIAITAYEPSPR